MKRKARKLRKALGDDQPQRIKSEPEALREEDPRATRAARRSTKILDKIDKSSIDTDKDDSNIVGGDNNNNNSNNDKSINDRSMDETWSDNSLNETRKTEVTYVDLTKIDSYTTVEGDCLVCRRRFHSRGSAQRHIRLLHLRLREYICHLCELDFPEKKNLKEHYRTSHKSFKLSGFKIPRFETENVTPIHQVVDMYPHGAGSWHAKSFMLSELDTTAEDSNASSLIENRSTNDAASEFECFYCHQDLKTSSSLRRHIKYFHKEKFVKDSSTLSNSFVAESKRSRKSDLLLKSEIFFNPTLEIDEEKFLREFEEMENQRNSYKLPEGIDDSNLNIDDEATTANKDWTKVRMVLQKMAACRKKQKTISPCLILNGANNKIEVVPPSTVDDVIDDDVASTKTLMDVDNGNVVTFFNAWQHNIANSFDQSSSSEYETVEQGSTSTNPDLQEGSFEFRSQEKSFEARQILDREVDMTSNEIEKSIITNGLQDKGTLKTGKRKKLRVRDPNVGDNSVKKKAPKVEQTEELAHKIKDDSRVRSVHVSELRSLRPRRRLLRA